MKESTMKRYAIEESEKWRDHCKNIPSIPMKTGWKMTPLPPFSGAMARFRITCGSAEVSVYLDVNDVLGSFGEPYWEVYPHDNDVSRFKRDDVKGLVKGIEESIKQQASDVELILSGLEDG